MKNFGYARDNISLLCKTLFLTKLHDRDLWGVWVMLHPKAPVGALDEAAAANPSSGGTSKSVRPKSSSEAPLEVDQVRHLLALLSEGEDREKVDKLVDRVDANRSGDIEFEELATLIRAISPANARAKELADVQVEAHPLLEQVQAIADGACLNVMHATQEQLEGASTRASKLGAAVKRLEGAHTVGVGEANGGLIKATGAIDKATFRLLHEVADAQLEMAAEGEERGSLTAYCSDTYAEALACLAQALRHAASLLEAHGKDTYDAHVALRTIRTIEQAERLQPSNVVDWRMVDVTSTSTAKGKADSGADGGSSNKPATAAKAASKAGGGLFGAAEAEARKAAEGMRQRITTIYSNTGGKRRGGLVGEDDAAAAAARKAQEVAEAEAELAAKAEIVAQRAFKMPTKGALEIEREQMRKTTHAVEAAKARKQMLTRESQAAILADQLRGEHEDAVAYAAHRYVVEQRAKNPRKHREWIVMGDHRTAQGD